MGIVGPVAAVLYIYMRVKEKMAVGNAFHATGIIAQCCQRAVLAAMAVLPAA